MYHPPGYSLPVFQRSQDRGPGAAVGKKDSNNVPRFDALICDIDGCLSPEDNAPMDAAALARLAAYNQRAIQNGDGPIITLCSGRPQPFVEAMARLLGNTVLPCVAENGVWLYYPGTNEYLRDPTITPENLAAVREATEWVEETLYPQGVTIQPGKSASISLYHPDTDTLKLLEPMIRATFERQGWPLRVSSTWRYINCDLEHISKGTGLDWLIASAGLSPARLAGFGDTLSDLAIAERVAFFAVPAKHDERLAPSAHHVSGHSMAWAVLDVLERVIPLLNQQEAPTPR